MLSRFDTISERDRRTDGQNYYININISIAVLTRDTKNVNLNEGQKTKTKSSVGKLCRDLAGRQFMLITLVMRMIT